MSKIICDICGTSYPDTADQCPICGYSREMNGDNILGNPEPQTEPTETVETVSEEPKVKAAPVPVKNRSKIVEEEDDFDEDEDDDEYDDDEDDDDEDEPRSNTALVVILVILIVALLAVTGFIFVKYFLPNMGGNDAEPSTTAGTVASTAAAETTAPRIACTRLTMTSEGNVVLEQEGANWLINVAASPEDTTDKILYASSDESVVTVNEAGKLTAVGQGEAVITVTCGEQLLQCNVTCFFIEETTEPDTTTAPEVFEDETTAPSEPEAETTAPVEETTAPTEEETKPESDEVTLTLNKKDISFGVVPAYYTLEIEEDIDPADVKWSSSNGSIVIVHDGKLQIVGYGTAKVYAEYKGVKAECIIRVVPM